MSPGITRLGILNYMLLNNMKLYVNATIIIYGVAIILFLSFCEDHKSLYKPQHQTSFSWSKRAAYLYAEDLKKALFIWSIVWTAT